MPEDGVEEEEGDVGDHGGDGQVRVPLELEVGQLLRLGSWFLIKEMG